MNLNKNISIWRGDSTPPTNYHFWIKSNGLLFTFNGEEWVNYVDDIPTASSESKGLMSSLDKVNLEECIQHLEDTSNPHQVSKELIGLSNVTNDAQVKRSELGVTVATLNDNGKITESLLPSYVDDILEGKLVSVTEFTLNEGQHGEVKQTGVIYLDTTTNTSYRWSGSQYVMTGSALTLGNSEDLAFPGNRGVNLENLTVVTNLTSEASREKVTLKVTLKSLDGKTESTSDVNIDVAGNGKAGLMGVIDKLGLSLLLDLGTIVGELLITPDSDSVKIEYDRVENGTDQATIITTIPKATTTTAGVMTAADKAVLDELPTSISEAEISSISNTLTANDVTIKATSANQELTTTIPEATTTSAGVMSSESRLILDKANSLVVKEKIVGELQAEIGINDVGIKFTSDIDGTEDTKRIIIPEATSTTAGILSSTRLNQVVENINTLLSHISNTDNPHQVTKLQVGLGNVTNDALVKRSEMGVANGVATLNDSSVIPQLFLSGGLIWDYELEQGTYTIYTTDPNITLTISYYKPIQYSDLVELRLNRELIPGTWYRITDYECTTTQEKTRSAGHQFDILVLATAWDTLSEEARAIRHGGDTYFKDSNLNAWKIWYTLDNDTTKYGWADEENGKGVIYRMIDEFQNDCPYDFKNILYFTYLDTDDTVESWMYTFSIVQDDNSVFDISLNNYDSKVDYKSSEPCLNNTISALVVKTLIDDSNCLDQVRYLNDIVLLGNFDYPSDNEEIVKYEAPYSNFFGPNCSNIRSYEQIVENKIHESYDLKFIFYCRSNNIVNSSIMNIGYSHYCIVRNCKELDIRDSNNIVSFEVFYSSIERSDDCHILYSNDMDIDSCVCLNIVNCSNTTTSGYNCEIVKCNKSTIITTSEGVFKVYNIYNKELNIPSLGGLTICSTNSNGEVVIYNPADHLSNVIAEEVASTSLEDTSTVSREEYENLLQRVIALENG